MQVELWYMLHSKSFKGLRYPRIHTGVYVQKLHAEMEKRFTFIYPFLFSVIGCNFSACSLLILMASEGQSESDFLFPPVYFLLYLFMLYFVPLFVDKLKNELHGGF